jgi:flagellar biosynthetic protein FliP
MLKSAKVHALHPSLKIKRHVISLGVVLLAVGIPLLAWAQAEIPLLTAKPQQGGGTAYSVSIQTLLFLTVLSFLPAILMLTTAFTRIVVVLAILRQGLGTVQTPTNQVLIGLALFLTAFIMRPVFEASYRDGVQPYLQEKIGIEEGLGKAIMPMRTFMLNQTRRADLDLFIRISQSQIDTKEPMPLAVLIPAFATSELKTAFQMGFLILIPFLIIDLVVASILMAMGMMMVSPMIISLPFKIMLFVMVDGWSLLMNALAGSFYI